MLGLQLLYVHYTVLADQWDGGSRSHTLLKAMTTTNNIKVDHQQQYHVDLYDANNKKWTDTNCSMGSRVK